jgi:hypothetical protein
MIAADCHLALGMPALLKRAFQKIVLQRQRSDLDMQELQIQLGSGRRALFPAKYAHRAIDKLTSPLRYLIGVNVELQPQFGQLPRAFDCGKGHFRFERPARGSGWLACSSSLLFCGILGCRSKDGWNLKAA